MANYLSNISVTPSYLEHCIYGRDNALDNMDT